MKKKKIGVVATSVAAIAVCSSMIVGSTFALFTSEDKVSVTVTSGKVNVTASVGELTATTSLNTEYEAKNSEQVAFENGGFASVDGGKITLNSITPGDTLTFPVTVENNSNVKVMSRVMYKVESGYLLASGLNITVNEKALTGKQEYSTGWEELKTTEYNFEISLPNHEGKLDNLYQDLSTEISFSVEAVQANAVKAGEGDVNVALPDYTDLKDAFMNGEDVSILTSESSIEDIADGGVIVLNDDVNIVGVANLANDAVIDLNGHNLDGKVSLNVEDGGNVQLSNGTVTAEWFKNPVTNKTVYQFVSVNGGALTVDNVQADLNGLDFLTVYDNCEVTINNSVIKAGGVGCYGISSNASQSYSPVININNTVISNARVGILFNIAGKLNITDSQIYGINQAVILRSGEAEITGSTLRNNVESFDGVNVKNFCTSTSEGELFSSYHNENHTWSSGATTIPIDTLVVGNKNGSYSNTATCILKNTAVIDGFVGVLDENSGEPFTHYAVFASRNTTVENAVSKVTYDEETLAKSNEMMAERGAELVKE